MSRSPSIKHQNLLGYIGHFSCRGTTPVTGIFKGAWFSVWFPSSWVRESRCRGLTERGRERGGTGYGIDPWLCQNHHDHMTLSHPSHPIGPERALRASTVAMTQFQYGPSRTPLSTQESIVFSFSAITVQFASERSSLIGRFTFQLNPFPLLPPPIHDTSWHAGHCNLNSET